MSAAIAGLAGVRVVDLTTTIAGAYTTKLLADAGAEVICVEPPEGSPLRRWSSSGSVPEGESGALWHFLSTSKRSVRSTVPDDELADLIAGADLLVEEGTVDVEALRRRHVQLVVLSVTPWGRTGPWADRPWTHFTVEAASGSVLGRGFPTEEPYQAGGRVIEWLTGAYGAASAVPAVFHARRSGLGAHLDCSMIEVMAVAGSTFADTMHSLLRRPALAGPARNVETPSIEPCKDGWIGFNTNSGQMFQNYLVLIERFDLMDDPDWASVQYRLQHLDEWNEMQHAWLREHTVEEILAKAAELRVAAAQVNDGETILTNEHFVDRGVFVENPAGFLQPRPPYLVDGDVLRPFEPAPELGEADGDVEPRPRPEPSGDGGDLPLSGVRVLDLTSWWAGPSATQHLAALGAEVLHVESTAHPDGMRATGYFLNPELWWEYGHLFMAVNPNKLDVTVDVTTPEGLALVERLIQSCDLVVENFAPRVTEGWGITWERVQELNPAAVFVRMPAFGLSGPWRERVGFAQTMEMMAGMAWLTGPAGGQPRIMRGPCDPAAGLHGALAMVTALEAARQTGKGHLVEAVMVEAAVNCAAEQIVEFTAYGEHLTRTGNRSPEAAPQGLYPCQGEERWLALSVATDEQWSALCSVLGWPDGPLSLAERHARHDELDGRLRAWAAGRAVEDAEAELVAAGVPAVVAWDPRIAHKQPQLAARRLYEDMDHPAAGTVTVPGLPLRWSGVDRWVRTPTPLLGEHNREVLQGLLGLSDADLADLEAKAIIGTKPA